MPVMALLIVIALRLLIFMCPKNSVTFVDLDINVDDNFTLKDNITRHILDSQQHKQVLCRFAAGFQPVFD